MSRSSTVSCARVVVSLLVLAGVASIRGAVGGTTVDLASYPDALVIDGLEVDDRIGVDAASCDFNGDGLRDLVVGADLANAADGRNDCGQVYLVLGRRGAWTADGSILGVTKTQIIGERSTDDLGEALGCGDLNHDGYDDMVLCAPWADRDRDGTWTSGQAHIIFGSASPPPLLDLSTTASTKILGTVYAGTLCKRVAIGDIDGNGRDDLILPDEQTDTPPPGTKVGRIYAFFNRANWPQTWDLRHQPADVTIKGPVGDAFGSNLLAGDWDGDGKSEIVACARLGDGKNNLRMNSGDIYSIHGRSNWPMTIDLSSSLAETMVWGPDANDQAGSVRGLGVGDVKGDSKNELVVGMRSSRGKGNLGTSVGEIRTIEGPRPLPAEIDLLTGTETTIWGATSGDQVSGRMKLGDVNGDGRDDIVATAGGADGPSESRTDCGETYVMLGRQQPAAETELSLGQEDLLVVGAVADDQMFLSSLADLNGDGLAEMVFSRRGSSQTLIPQLVIVSPYDIDGDGVTQLPDNCPLIANPDQLDSNNDQRGDACALDWDGDTVLDENDCANTDKTAGRPQAVAGLLLSHQRATNATSLTWPALRTADRYDVNRGLVSSLPSGDYGACRTSFDPDPTDTLFIDVQTPSAGTSYFYLVRGVDAGCGGAGSWGQTSNGVERTNQNPASCP